MTRRALVAAVLAASCAPTRLEPCAVQDDVVVAFLPDSSGIASGPAIDALAADRIRLRWWVPPQQLFDGGVGDPLASMATFDGDGGLVSSGVVPWPVFGSPAAAQHVLQNGAPLWADDGAAQIQQVLTASVDLDGTQHTHRSLRYAFAADGGLRYDDVPGTAGTDCNLNVYSQRMPTRVVSLFNQLALYTPQPTPTDLPAAFTSFDGGSAGLSQIPDAGDLFASATSLQRNAVEGLFVLGSPANPTAYDETLTKVAGPISLPGAGISALDVTAAATVAAWQQSPDYILVQAFDSSGAPLNFSARVTSARDVLAVARNGSYVATAVWDGASIWTAVAQSSGGLVTSSFGHKLGGDIPIAGPYPRQTVARPAPGGFVLWLLAADSLRQVRLRCEGAP